MFHGRGFQQTVGIPMDTQGAPLLVYVRNRLHTGASQDKQKEAKPILHFYVPLYR